MILLDTNILIHGNQEASPHFEKITSKLIELADKDEKLVICPQVLYEFYVVATRPVAARGGLGISNIDALSQINKFQSVYNFMDDPADLFSTWLHLIEQYGSAGVTGHDARLVAFMRSHQVDNLYTLNSKDFNRYNDIITIIV